MSYWLTVAVSTSRLQFTSSRIYVRSWYILPCNIPRRPIGEIQVYTYYLFNLDCLLYATLRPLYPWERLCTHRTVGWVAPGPIWTGAKNLGPAGFRTQNPPAPESRYLCMICVCIYIYHLRLHKINMPSTRTMYAFCVILRICTIVFMHSDIMYYRQNPIDCYLSACVCKGDLACFLWRGNSFPLSVSWTSWFRWLIYNFHPR